MYVVSELGNGDWQKAKRKEFYSMKENVIIVKCEVPSEAYQMLTTLRNKPEDEGYKISHGALVKKNAGELTLEDGFVAEDEKGRGWTGGLIGGLAGLLAGPVGMLVKQYKPPSRAWET